MRRTVPPSAEIQVEIDKLLGKRLVDDPQSALSAERRRLLEPTAWRQPLALVSSSLARWPTTHAARGCRIGLMQLSALSPGLCSLQPLVLGCAVSDWHVPPTVCGTGAVRSRSDGSGPLDVTFAAAFRSA